MDIKVNLNIFAMIIIFYLTGQIEIYGIFMLFILLHELGHLIIGMLLGFKPKTLKIMPLGLSISFKVYCKDYNIKIKKSNILSLKKIGISITGPIINLIIAFAFCFISDGFLGIRQDYIVYSNILIAIFNLLPIYPLDGGRILKNILHITKGLKNSIIYTNTVSNIVVILLTFISSIGILYYKNIAILFVIIYLWIMMFIQNKRFKMKMKIYELIER